MKQKLIGILMSHTNLNYIEAEGVVEEMMGELEKALEPALTDFTGAGQLMIKDGRFTNSGTEILENVGYMKGVLTL